MLLIAIIGINFLPSTDPVPEPTRPASTAVAAQPTTISSTPSLPPILQATVLPSPTPTITPRPNIAPEANILLYGPPNNSRLPLDGRISFYWHYSQPLLPGQELIFTLRQNDNVIAAAQLKQPNFGNSYQTLIELEEIATAGTAVWQVHLQWADEGIPLLTSEERTLIAIQN